MNRNEVLPPVHNNELDENKRAGRVNLDRLLLETAVHALHLLALADCFESVPVRSLTPLNANFSRASSHEADLIDVFGGGEGQCELLRIQTRGHPEFARITIIELALEREIYLRVQDIAGVEPFIEGGGSYYLHLI